MTNSDAGEKLISMARVSYRDLISSFESKQWNAVIGRAQEVVELYLKGLLKFMGVEYPKMHDVGRTFASVCIQRGIGLDQKILTKISEISLDLAEKRAPAFYMEVDYSEADAVKARSDVDFFLSICEPL